MSAVIEWTVTAALWILVSVAISVPLVALAIWLG